MSSIWEQTLRMFSFSDANVRYVFLGMILLGASSGVLGSLTLLRKRALIGDALAHAALPGIGIAFLITGTKVFWTLLLGAYISGIAGVLSLIAIRRYSRIKEDTALAIVLTVFFGAGIVILTYIQKSGKGAQSGLDKFLFGQSASLISSDVVLIGVVALMLVILQLILHKEFKLLCFNPEYGDSLGFSAGFLDMLLMGMAVAAVVIGLQAVGVVLMAALLIIPPSTARLWSNNFGHMIVLAGIIGSLSGAIGSYLSFLAPRMPSGPLTVLAGSGIFIFSLLVAPERGVITKLIRNIKLRRSTSIENTLRAIAEYMEREQKSIESEFSIAEIASIRNWETDEIRRKLSQLNNAKYSNKSGDRFTLAVSGVSRASSVLRRHRLWEIYLMHQADIAEDHVHRAADDVEHFLTPEMEERLLELAGDGADGLLSPHPLSRTASS